MNKLIDLSHAQPPQVTSGGLSASRGMRWILRSGSETLSTEDMKDYLHESHRLASLNLTKKLQKELGLNQGDEG